MIYVKWVYKGSVVSVTRVDEAYTIENIVDIKSRVIEGIIKSPENYERYFISDCEDGGLYVG